MSSKKNALNGIGNKTSKKSTKSDIFRAAVGFYLKHKCYVGSEKFRKSDFVLSQNHKQFVFQRMLDADMHCTNCFQFSNVLCLTNNQQIADQQFGRFSQFVESQSDAIRSELKRFYGPMLCHLYFELAKAREPKAAVEFLRKYAHLVAPVETYEAPMPNKINGCPVSNENNVDTTTTTYHSQIRFVRDSFATEDPEQEYFLKLIQTLSTCTKLEAAESDADVMNFRSSKYEIHTSQSVVDALCAFFEKRGHVLILNLLYTWIHVHIIDNEVHQWTEDNLFLNATTDDEDLDDDCCRPDLAENALSCTLGKRPAEVPTATHAKRERAAAPLDTGGDEQQAKRPAQLSLQSLYEVKEQLTQAQAEFPRYFKIADNFRGLTSAHIDTSDCHLAAGFNDSVVRLWQLDQHICRGRNLYQFSNAANCRWELNNLLLAEQEQEDEPQHLDTIDTSKRVVRKYYAGKYEGNSYNEYGGIELRGHGLGVTDVRFSAQSPLLYSVSKDSTIRSWRADNYACAAIYRGHRYPIWCVDESPVGLYLATGSKDLTARLWSLEREFPLITYAGHTQDVECLAFHPNGNYIATGSTDLTVRLWCVTSGKLMRVFSDCKQPVCTIAFSPDGKLLAAGGEESKVRVFDLAAGAQLCELREHEAAVTSLAWSATGHLLASVCRNGSLRVHNTDQISLSSGSSTSAATTATPRTPLLAGNCQRLVRVLFCRGDAICCVGN